MKKRKERLGQTIKLRMEARRGRGVVAGCVPREEGIKGAILEF